MNDELRGECDIGERNQKEEGWVGIIDERQDETRTIRYQTTTN